MLNKFLIIGFVTLAVVAKSINADFPRPGSFRLAPTSSWSLGSLSPSTAPQQMPYGRSSTRNGRPSYQRSPSMNSYSFNWSSPSTLSGSDPEASPGKKRVEIPATVGSTSPLSQPMMFNWSSRKSSSQPKSAPAGSDDGLGELSSVLQSVFSLPPSPSPSPSPTPSGSTQQQPILRRWGSQKSTPRPSAPASQSNTPTRDENKPNLGAAASGWKPPQLTKIGSFNEQNPYRAPESDTPKYGSSQPRLGRTGSKTDDNEIPQPTDNDENTAPSKVQVGADGRSKVITKTIPGRGAVTITISGSGIDDGKLGKLVDHTDTFLGTVLRELDSKTTLLTEYI